MQKIIRKEETPLIFDMCLVAISEGGYPMHMFTDYHLEINDSKSGTHKLRDFNINQMEKMICKWTKQQRKDMSYGGSAYGSKEDAGDEIDSKRFAKWTGNTQKEIQNIISFMENIFDGWKIVNLI